MLKIFLSIAWNTSKSLNWFSKAMSKKGFSFKLIKYKLFKFHFPLSSWLSFVNSLLLAVQLDQEDEKWNSFASWNFRSFVLERFEGIFHWIVHEFSTTHHISVILNFPRTLIYYTFTYLFYFCNIHTLELHCSL